MNLGGRHPRARQTLLDNPDLLSRRPAPTSAAVRHRENVNLRHEAMVVHSSSLLSELNALHQTALAGSIRYARRQIVRSDREIPYRRAVAEPCRRPRRLSSTIRTLSASDQCRRRPTSSAAKISIGETTEAHAIRQCLKANRSIEADGRHRRLTIAARCGSRPEILALRRIRARWAARGGNVHLDRHRQAQRHRPAGMARRRHRPHLRHAGLTPARIAPLELEADKPNRKFRQGRIAPALAVCLRLSRETCRSSITPGAVNSNACL